MHFIFGCSYSGSRLGGTVTVLCFFFNHGEVKQIVFLSILENSFFSPLQPSCTQRCCLSFEPLNPRVLGSCGHHLWERASPTPSWFCRCFCSLTSSGNLLVCNPNHSNFMFIFNPSCSCSLFLFIWRSLKYYVVTDWMHLSDVLCI